MNVAEVIAQKSDCFRAKTGAVIVSSENRIISSGYNGPPADYIKGDLRCDPIPVHSFETGFLETIPGPTYEVRHFNDCRDYCPRAQKNEYRADYDNCPSIHAESNAIAWADRSLMRGGTLYTTGWPCYTCAKLMSNCGLDRIVTAAQAETPYREEDAVWTMFRLSKMNVVVMNARS